MIGNLTIDKASMNISYFLNSVLIVHSSGGRISRKDFVKQMAEFVGIPAIKNGKENRTPYNKSKLPRYFGFIDVDTDESGNNFLVLTNRGKKLVSYIMENPDNEPSKYYSISEAHREDFIDLIFESIIFDSFGKNNCGAEQSNTDVEPPKVVFKTIQELGGATAEEICYVMFGLNRGVFGSFANAIDAVRKKRDVAQYDYSKIMSEWDIVNIVNDCKIINIFTNENIQLLISEKNDSIGKTFYYLSPNLSESHLNQIKNISAIYQPLKMLVYSDGDENTINTWVNDTVLGRISDNSFVFNYCNGDRMCGVLTESGFLPGLLETALLKAFKNPKKNIYLVINNTNEKGIFIALDKYCKILKRVYNLSDAFNGWSESQLYDTEVYTFLEKEFRQINRILETGCIKLPSNFHLVGTITMDNNIENNSFDFEFTKTLVKTNNSNGPKSDLHIGQNLLLYGVPGCGKSHKIETEICEGIDDFHKERVVFHPDYTYSDFVGQILPDSTGGIISYPFIAGPFTRIMQRACSEEHKNEPFYLIIEEINRGNAPAIFGDIFQSLDRDKTGRSRFGITNKEIAREIYGEGHENDKVYIPSNLVILATMNTADQNVFTLDTAFKRRWDMESIRSDFSKCKHAKTCICGTDLTWETFVTEINKAITDDNSDNLSSEDNRLGAWFIKENDLYDPHIFAEKVLMYLWNDAFKFSRDKVFKSKYKTLDDVVDGFVDSRFCVFTDAFSFSTKDVVATENADNESGNLTVDAYLEGKDEQLIVLYNALYDAVNVEIPELSAYTVGSLNYIGFTAPNISKRNFCDVMFQKDRLVALAEAPSEGELLSVGEQLEYDGHKNHYFKFYINNAGDIETAVKILVDSYYQLQKDTESSEDSSAEITIEQYLAGKTPKQLEIYHYFVDYLNDNLTDLILRARKIYIAVNYNNRNIAEIQFSNGKVYALTKEPNTEELKIGNHLPASYRWTNDYRIELTDDNAELVFSAISDAYGL